MMKKRSTKLPRLTKTQEGAAKAIGRQMAANPRAFNLDKAPCAVTVSKPAALNWYQLSGLENGTAVVFTENTQARLLPDKPERDIRETQACIVSKGTTATVLENGLNELWCCMVIRIEGKPVMDVVIGQHLDPGADTHVPVAERTDDAKAWFQASPVRRAR